MYKQLTNNFSSLECVTHSKRCLFYFFSVVRDKKKWPFFRISASASIVVNINTKIVFVVDIASLGLIMPIIQNCGGFSFFIFLTLTLIILDALTF